jgi:hypothetical protein
MGGLKMKDREIACQFYIYEGNCSKGREGTFRKQCQTCKKYVPVKGGRPARTDTRAKRLARIERKEVY